MSLHQNIGMLTDFVVTDILDVINLKKYNTTDVTYFMMQNNYCAKLIIQIVS
jgi:hypothetical protein